VRVSVLEVNANPLRFKVEVRGPGLAIGGATLNYYLYRAVQNPDEDYPLIEILSGTNQTDSAGLAFLEFPTVDGSKYAYTIIVYAHLGGLVGVGYCSHLTITNNKFIVPFIEDFEQGLVLLAHNWDISPPAKGEPAALHYNTTFLLLTENFGLNQIQIANSSGLVNYGEGKPYQQLQIPASEAGILLVAYRKGNEYGISIMPWGISTLGVSVTFGDPPSGREWVATELRQVIVNEMSYQVKLAVWSLKD